MHLGLPRLSVPRRVAVAFIALQLAALIALPALGTLSSPGRAQEDADAGAASDDAGGQVALEPAAVGEEAVAPAAGPPAEPMELYTGLYPVRVAEFDLASGQATITYYVWTRWTGPYDGSNYDLMNGAVESRDHDYTQSEGGVSYAWYRYHATADLETDFHGFPLDEHCLHVDLEHAEYDAQYLRFVVDRESIARLDAPTISGWDVDPPVYEVSEHVYPTNWGLPEAASDDSSTYSTFRWSVRVHHSFAATFPKTFLALFISVLIALAGFFMHPEELEARVGVCVAGIFGAVTSHAVVAGNLPDIPYMTLSDKIHFAGMGTICVALAESCYTGFLARAERTDEALQIDRKARLAVGPAYALLVVLFVLFR